MAWHTLEWTNTAISERSVTKQNAIVKFTEKDEYKQYDCIKARNHMLSAVMGVSRLDLGPDPGLKTHFYGSQSRRFQFSRPGILQRNGLLNFL